MVKPLERNTRYVDAVLTIPKVRRLACSAKVSIDGLPGCCCQGYPTLHGNLVPSSVHACLGVQAGVCACLQAQATRPPCKRDLQREFVH